jgi:cell wall-associated NlpC family hydrolase
MGRVKDLVFNYIGLPYIWAGNHPLVGFDCSGLVCEVLKSNGLLHHRSDLTAQGIYNYLNFNKWKSVDELNSEPQEGDIIFYGERVDKIRHCSVALDSKLMIEAGGGDMTTKTLEDAKIKGACVRIRSIKYRTDYLCCLRNMKSYV